MLPGSSARERTHPAAVPRVTLTSGRAQVEQRLGLSTALPDGAKALRAARHALQTSRGSTVSSSRSSISSRQYHTISIGSRRCASVVIGVTQQLHAGGVTR